MTAVAFDVRDPAPAGRSEALRAAVGPSVPWVEVDHRAAAAGAVAARGPSRRSGRPTQAPAAPHDRRPAITAMARGRGFRDAGRCGRPREEAYGIPPGEWRTRSRPADGTRA
ncbi:hypothetical protein ACIRBZ_34785 [Streptomyces sp. NPDC094038]|uniref:hypothetical protein n=1 Tax=Streptomyces sp. NPDC094038 TaxID=3366055 RepID=UPI0038025CDF